MKIKIAAVSLIGLLISAGLILAGCEAAICRGDGQCTVTIGQGAQGLFIDNTAPRSTCGVSATWSDMANAGAGGLTGGCRVQRNIDNRPSGARHFGTHSCDC